MIRRLQNSSAKHKLLNWNLKIVRKEKINMTGKEALEELLKLISLNKCLDSKHINRI